jgi:hypothetical protein
VTIAEWLDLGPNRPVSRSELLRVFEGFELVTRSQLMDALRGYERARRQRVWYRRLWRWIVQTVTRPAKHYADLTPEQRQHVREQLDAAEQRGSGG